MYESIPDNIFPVTYDHIKKQNSDALFLSQWGLSLKMEIASNKKACLI